jgi:response regulator RpfG family c-di-GMP phosphodiesterase
VKKRILFVDDDANILAGYKRTLRNDYDVTTAEGGQIALDLIKVSTPFSVIISDYKMPEMDGVRFLTAARQLSKDSVRVMLTGFADVEAAIEAVNEGNIFRFLTKPCPAEKLLRALSDSSSQYELIVSEKELLNNTLKGSIQLLIDILSAVNPVAFSRASRLSNLVSKIIKRMDIDNQWEFEIAALLSQIGCVTIPSELLERKYADKPLTMKESELFLSHPVHGKFFLSNIPRLENIANAIALQYECFNLNEDSKGKRLPLISRVLKVVTDYDTYIESGKTSAQALFQMHKDDGWYDPEILSALDSEAAGIEKNFILKTLFLKDIFAGMVLAENILDNNNMLLIAKGNIVTEVLKFKLENLCVLKRIREPIKVLIPALHEIEH